MSRTVVALSCALSLLACARTPQPLPVALDPSNPSAPEAAHHPHSHALSEAPSDAAESRSSHYSCPHHPEVVSDAPGICPKCQMALEPVEEGTGGSGTDTAHYACPHHPEVVSKEPGTCPKCKMALEPVRKTPDAATEAATYSCPHHPEVVSKEPGTCPKCKMALEPASKSGAEPHGGKR